MTAFAASAPERSSISRALISPVSLTTFCLVAALATALAIRFDQPRPTREEVSRAASPDGRLSAVVYEMSGDNRSPFAYDVAVAGGEKSQEAAFLLGAMRNDRSYGVNVRWIGASELRVEYLTARVQSVTADQIVIAGKTIHVSLQSGMRDESAPPGGMSFNLKHSSDTGF